MSKQLPKCLAMLEKHFPRTGLKRGEFSFIAAPRPLSGNNPSFVILSELLGKQALGKTNITQEVST